jgi:signal transduction histidine kinase
VTGVAAPRLVLVFFVYGLAFFAMGLAIALEARRSTEARLARSLNYLAAFGLLHAGVEWIDMWLVLPLSLPPPSVTALRVARLTLLAVGTLALATFGTSLIAYLSPPYRWVRWVPPLLLAVWVGYWTLGPHVQVLATPGPSPWGPSCLRCHDGVVLPSRTEASAPSVAVADIWARYLIYLPGSLFAAVGLVLQGQRFERDGYGRIARDCRWMAAAFVVNGLVAGLIVPPAAFAPASWLNYDRFLSVVGVPPQVFRAALAVVITFFGVRVLRVFDLEYARRLAEAQEGRLRAQAEALEVARKAAEDAVAWSRELEAKVRERTEELFEQVRRLAILEERDRLARELHDSLGQVLGFVNLKAKVAEDLIARGRTDEATEELSQMRDAVQEVYEDVRQAILSLRTAPQPRGLLPTLREYVDRVREQTGLDVRLEAPEDVRLPPAAEVQVIRIVQEALTNVRKHARASTVWVRFAREGGGTVVTVTDDGRGFDLADVQRAPGARFGLQTMRERAESVGGSLTVDTAPGRGTTVRVFIPGGRADGTHSGPGG